MSPAPSPSRRAALALLDQVIGQGRTLAEAAPVLQALAPADRAAAQRLATETLRWMDRADRLLKPYLHKRPAARVMTLLRLGTVELALGGAAHGVVSDCVSLAMADKRTASAKGLINAVLRKVAEEAPARWSSLHTPRLPRWLRGPLSEAWGPQAVSGIERAHAAGAPVDLTARRDPGALADRLGAELLPTGSLRLREAGQISALPGFAEGEWWVQDAAAALPARLLGDVAGLRVLDLCAAPGGKTLQLAAAGGRVTAVDLSAHRLTRLRENLGRCGLQAEVVEGDALSHHGHYDAILLDAPCSATGTIRRHPDLPHASEGGHISGLIDLQAAMLDHALGLLAPGGRLVFATCSLLPDEGECQIDAALGRHPGLRVLPPALEGLEPGWISSEGGLRLRPDFWADRGGLDGFYMAALSFS
jgi:16S rRNA (cytosine967-C5)-methyltransferase